MTVSAKSPENKAFLLIHKGGLDTMMRAEREFVVPARLDSPQRTLGLKGHAMTAPYPIVPGVEFKPVEGFPGYVVGDDGSVWSLFNRGGRGAARGGLGETWRRIKAAINSDGYQQLMLRTSGRRKTFVVHCLVLSAFIGPRPAGMEGCHADGNPANNRLENLRWDTRRANSADSRRHGTLVMGVRCRSAKLNEGDVRTIRELRSQGASYGGIAREYGVDKETIYRLIKGRTWKHVV